MWLLFYWEKIKENNISYQHYTKVIMNNYIPFLPNRLLDTFKCYKYIKILININLFSQKVEKGIAIAANFNYDTEISYVVLHSSDV